MTTRTPNPTRLLMLVGWPLFVLSAAATVLANLMGVHLIPFLPEHDFGFFDLRIYRDAADVVLHGHALYAAKFRLGFGFTYPPFAALMLIGLPGLSLRIDEAVVTGLNIALVVLVVRLALELAGNWSANVERRERRATLWLLSAVALWTEPIVSAIAYGQIDLLVAALVLVDLTRGSRSRWGGAGIGFAAALKLTPLIFVPYLLLTGRIRMALRAIVAFAVAIDLSFIAVPHDAGTYWGSVVFSSSRVTGRRSHAGRGVANQSLRGLLERLGVASSHLPEVWLGTCLMVGVTGLWLAVRAARRHDQLLGFTLTAVTGLLVCPVSWTHHWVIATPVLLLALRAPRGIRRFAAGGVALAAALGSSAIWLAIKADGNGGHLSAGQLPLADLYVLAGLALLTATAAWELRAAFHRDGGGRELPRRVSPDLALLGRSPGLPGGGFRGFPASQRTPGRRQSRT